MIVVGKYPTLEESNFEPNKKSKFLQSMNPVTASCSSKTSAPNCFLSWFCTGPRAAHTFHVTGILNYWVSLLTMTICPCCTLMVVNSCTDLNTKLGGEKDNLLLAGLCACCCPVCVVAQDAASLDAMTGMDTEL